MKEEIKALRGNAFKAAKEVAEKKIEELKKEFIKFLENKKETIFDQSDEQLVQEISAEVFRRKGGVIGDEERVVFNDVASHVKGLMYDKLTEIIEEARKTLGLKEKVRIPGMK